MGTEPGYHERARGGRLTGLFIAATGVFWIGAMWAGEHWDWTQRTRALFDLVALAGFLFALIMSFRIWRARQKDEGR